MTTDVARPMPVAIRVAVHAALRPVEISARSATVNIRLVPAISTLPVVPPHRGWTRGYRMVTAGFAAQKHRSRAQARKVEMDAVLRTRVLADLKRSRTPRQIAGRLTLEAKDASVELTKGSTNAHGKTVSHQAIYQFIYAMPRGERAKNGVFL